MFERYELSRIGDNDAERRATSRMAWVGFQSKHGRSGTPKRRGKGKGASRKGA